MKFTVLTVVLIVFNLSSSLAQLQLSKSDSLLYAQQHNTLLYEEKFEVLFHDSKQEHAITHDALNQLEKERKDFEQVEFWINEYTQVFLPSRSSLCKLLKSRN